MVRGREGAEEKRRGGEDEGRAGWLGDERDRLCMVPICALAAQNLISDGYIKRKWFQSTESVTELLLSHLLKHSHTYILAT